MRISPLLTLSLKKTTEGKMKNIKLVFMLGLLFLGMTATAAAQRSYRDGRGYSNDRRSYQRQYPRTIYRQQNRRVYYANQYRRDNNRYWGNQQYYNNNRYYNNRRYVYNNRGRSCDVPRRRVVRYYN